IMMERQHEAVVGRAHGHLQPRGAGQAAQAVAEARPPRARDEGRGGEAGRDVLEGPAAQPDPRLRRVDVGEQAQDAVAAGGPRAKPVTRSWAGRYAMFLW